MSEDEVAKNLADSLPQEEARDYSYKDPVPEDQNFVDKMTPEEQLTRGQLMDYFDIPMHERHGPKVDNWINEIYAWAREQAGSGEYHDLLRVINEQEMHMGSKLKPQRTYRLYEYIKIARIRKQLAERERLIYG